MRLRALEVPARFGDPGGRLEDVRAALAAGDPVDLVLLPECALTGYVSTDLDFDLRPFAEPLDGPTLAAYRALAREHRAHLAAPIIEKTPEATFNSFVVVDPQGVLLGHYRKRHPWHPETWAARGTLPYPDLRIGGLKLTLAVCYDIHFLTSEIPGLLATTDVLLFPSAWVDDDVTDLRADLFAALIRRFGLTVVNANWGPGEPRLPGQGRSRIVGPGGAVEARPGRGGISSVVAEVGPRRSRQPCG
jgi:predicted amidohydrolase